jgi:uncharacterized protein (TIGR00251 family)
LLIEVHVTPGARHDEITGLAEGVLRVRVAAPPRDGRANDALVRLLARALGVSLARVEIARGHRSRRKLVRVSGISHEEAKSRLAPQAGET